MTEGIERRRAVRKRICVCGVVRLDAGKQVPVWTVDASNLGAAVRHDGRLPLGVRALCYLHPLDSSGNPTVLRIKVDIRHTVLSCNGSWRTGLHFAEMSDVDRKALELMLASRFSVPSTDYSL